MSCSQLLKDLKQISDGFMKSQGIEKYNIDVTGSSEKGENYCGEVTYFKITSEQDGKVFDLVMKTAKKSEELRKTLPISNVYGRELYMYSKVFPTFEKFLHDKHSGIEIDYIPKIYWVCNDIPNETLIMENLRNRGFKLWDRKKPVNSDHVISVLTLMGKHHGISLSMREQTPAVFRTITCNLNLLSKEFMSDNQLDEFFGTPFKHVLKLLEENGRKDLVSKFALKEDMVKSIFETIPEEDRLVVCHGDCWINNIMFKYEEGDSSKPAETNFLDFQLSMLDTPVKDLSYFLYSACDEFLLCNLNSLLQVYHDSLSSTVATLGGNCEEIFPYESLKKHWTKYAKYGLIFSLVVLKVELFDSTEAPDLTKIAEEGGAFEKGFNGKMKNQTEYDRRILELFTHFGENFL